MSRDNSLRYGITGGSPATRRRQMDADDAAMRAADERTQQKWSRAMAKKTKQTSFGPVRRPPTTDRAEDGLGTLNELLGDVVEAIRDADKREQIIDSASDVDTARFPSVRGGAR